MARHGVRSFTRLAGVGLLSLVHLGLLMSVTVSSLGGLLSRGPNGEDLAHAYRESETGRRYGVVSEVLSWPIIKPVAMIESQLSGRTIRSTPWRAFAAAAFYTNSLAWGVGMWVLVEVLARSVYRGLQRMLGWRKADLPGPDDAKASQ